MILSDYITDVSRNLAFIIFIAQIICYIVVLKLLKQHQILHNSIGRPKFGGFYEKLPYCCLFDALFLNDTKPQKSEQK